MAALCRGRLRSPRGKLNPGRRDAGQREIAVTTTLSLSHGVLAALAAKLDRQGYRQLEQTFWKETGDCRLLFHVSFIRHREEIEITADVAVRHHAVEELLNAERGDLKPRERKQTATVGVELGNWIKGQPQCWTVTKPAEIEGVAVDIADWLDRFGIPFLDRFASLDEIARVLEQEGAEADLIRPFAELRRKTRAAVASVLRERSKNQPPTRRARG